jgi:chromosome segregation ATPase
MPTGIPKDPAAHAAKLEATKAKRDALKVEKFGEMPPKRTYKKRVSANGTATAKSTSPVVEKPPVKRSHTKRTYKKQTTPRKNSVAHLTAALEERDSTVQNLENLLSVAQGRISHLESRTTGADSSLVNQGETVTQLKKALSERDLAIDDLCKLAETHSKVYAELFELNSVMQERAETAERRLASLLDLI